MSPSPYMTIHTKDLFAPAPQFTNMKSTPFPVLPSPSRSIQQLFRRLAGGFQRSILFFDEHTSNR